MGKAREYMQESEVVTLLRKTTQVYKYTHSKAFKDGLLNLIDTANIDLDRVANNIDKGVITCGVGAARKYLNLAKDTIRLEDRRLEDVRGDKVVSQTEYVPELANRIISSCNSVVHAMLNGIVYNGSETLSLENMVKLASEHKIMAVPMTANDFMASAFKATENDESKRCVTTFTNSLLTPNSQHSNLFFDYKQMITRLETLSATMRFTQFSYPDTELGKTVADVMTKMAPYVSDYHFDLLGIDAEYIRLNSDAGIPMAIFSKGGLTGGMGTRSAGLPKDSWVLDEVKKDSDCVFGLLITPDLKVTEIDPTDPMATMALVDQYMKSSKKNSPRIKN